MRRALIIFLAVILLYFFTVYFYLTTQPAWYSASFEVLAADSAPDPEGIVENGIRIVRSIEILEELLRTTRPMYWESIKDDPVRRYSLIAETMKQRVRTEKLSPRSFSVACYNPEQGEARDFCHNLSDLFIKFTLDRMQEKKRSYRNRLFTRLRLIKKFLEKAENEYNLLQVRDEKMQALQKSQKQRDEVMQKLDKEQIELDAIGLYFKKEKTSLINLERKVSGQYQDEWPDLKKIRKRLILLEETLSAKSAAELNKLQYDQEDTEWRDKKHEEFVKKRKLQLIQNDLLNIEKKVESDKKAFEAAEAMIAEKFAELPHPESEKEKAEPEKPKTVNEYVEEMERKEAEERLFINSLRELDSSTNPPSFTKAAIREKVTALKGYAQQIQCDLAKIESILETETSPYTIINRMPFARKVKISESQPIHMLAMIGFIIAALAAAVSLLFRWRSRHPIEITDPDSR